MRIRLILFFISIVLFAPAWGKPSLPVSSVPKSAPESIRMALNDLYSGDNDTIGDALITLQEKGTLGAVAAPYLISMLDDETDLTVQGLSTIADEAAEALVAIGVRVKSEVTGGLKSRNALIRGRCAYVLGRLRDSSSAAVLNEMAKSERDNNARINAIRALGSIRNRSSIVHLLGMLNDPHEKTADAVVHALADFGYTAIKPLSYNLKDPDTLKRANAARALGYIKDPLVIDDIVKMTEDSEPVVRRAAAEALGNLNMIQAIEPLIRMLSDDDTKVKNSALISLETYSREKIIQPVIFNMDNFDEKTAAEARRIIYETEKNMTIPLIKKGLSSGSDLLKLNLLQIVMEMKEERLLGDVISLFRVSASAEIRHKAIDTMISIGDRSIIDPLQAGLSSTDKKLSAHALAGLVTLNAVTREVADMVKERLYDPDSEIQGIVAGALPYTDSYRITPIMDEALKISANPEVKVQALESLGRLKYTKSLENIYPLMNDPSPDVRQAAAKAIVMIGHKDSAEILKAHVNDGDTLVRKLSLEGLKNINASDYSDIFADKLNDSDHSVRAEAAEALGVADDKDALNMLIKIFYDDEHIEPRIAALKSLSDINTDLTVAFEMDGLKSRNRELKKAALECSVKYKDKDVYLKLVSLFKDDDTEIAGLAAEALKKLSKKDYETYDDWLKWAVKQK